MKLSRRKLVFIFLTSLSFLLTVYFIISKEWFLFVIGVLFSFIAAYNITCEDK